MGLFFGFKSKFKLPRFLKRINFEEPRKFVEILIWYFGKKIGFFGKLLERFKDYLVDLLLYKRGRFSKVFLHGGMVFIVAGVLVSAPILASNYPILNIESRRIKLAEASSSVLKMDTAETTTEKSEKPRDKVVEHRVSNGETLSQIASEYQVSLESIKWLNPDVKNWDELSVGDILKIPPVSGVIHLVSSGDTVYSIAKKYRTNAQKIVDFPFNQFADDETFDLIAGTEVVVPDGVPPVAPPPAPLIPLQYGVYGTPIAGGSGMFMWPTTGAISQYFTWYHSGVDIANPSAPVVTAAMGGRVVIAEKLDWGYGWHIVIDHGNGYQTLYGHLQAMYVSTEPGHNEVSVGQAIGQMGSTGRSTGTHLHFEVRYNGVFQNPLQFLK